ncbi:flagellar export chaperone FlgN [Paraglaciecola polaris]|uniref:Flagella synthesis protein FlgN n=1 Tax=Paraglaciecola polaris LMG 21857 TaxID=1129793 RepID=K6ZVZ7_9ALTE|nr:flagellar export chaperone FlgN [Paraglaciecola polaris]GAC34422.1 flagella synthesis protein FlgN [Paraglaciecola polaris LMG 21857]|tara:strand:- start:4470 stop:4898 length:429 start_codon:yes stop_codon:yes gene_type:complete
MSELIKAITTQFDHLEDLIQALDSELHLISSRDAEALINLLKNKENLLTTVQQQDDVISAAFEASSETDRTSEEVVALFDRAKQLVSECQYRTKINQTAVEQGQLRLEHLRTLLLESRAKESMTYDKSGKAQGGRSGRGISA